MYFSVRLKTLSKPIFVFKLDNVFFDLEDKKTHCLMSDKMRLRVSSKDGTYDIALEYPNVSLGDLIGTVKQKISPNYPESITIGSIKSGFPPRPIDLNNLAEPVSSLGIKNGDKIIIETETKGQTSSTVPTGGSHPRRDTKSNNNSSSSSSSEIPSVELPETGKHLILRNVPDDNSCLFNALTYAVHGFMGFETESKKTPHPLRAVVASYVRSDPLTYNEVILGRDPEEYCNWIEKKDSWGGAIELGILADYFEVRINCVDIESGSILTFQNESKEPLKFVILVYSGVHYDLMCVNDVVSTTRADKLKDSSFWPTHSGDQTSLLSACKSLCKLLQSKNYATNTTTFRVRCLECYTICVGEMGANKHASETNHVRFGEVKD